MLGLQRLRFAPNPDKSYVAYNRVARKKWTALMELCADIKEYEKSTDRGDDKTRPLPKRMERMMDDNLVRIGRDIAEMEGPVHERAGQTRGQGPRIDAQVSIRVASPGDGERLRGMFSRVSPETIYRRFHIPYPDVPERTLALMLDVDQHDKESLVAVADEEIVGHAMYVKLGDGREAEMAIIVEDRYQSKGVGKLLLRKLAEKARNRGVEAFVGTVLLENRRMLGLIGAVFTESRRVIADDVFHFRVPSRTLEPADPARILRRAA